MSTILDFRKIRSSVQKQFDKMAKTGKLFIVALDKDVLWNTYLNSFPEGTNPIYKQRTEHDCNCCKQFIRAVGNVVTITDGKIETIWDGIVGDPHYQVVADAMASYVKSNPINNVFLHYERSAGTEKNFAAIVGGGAKQWDHFHVMIPAQYVTANKDIATKLGEIRSTFDVMHRGLTELSKASVRIVLELIAQNSLYRGEEHKFALTEFQNLKNAFDKIPTKKQSAFVWSKVQDGAGSVARFRNTVIGTLVTDLSNGVDLEDAVKMFESKVAPANYKRPTALVTKAMIENAKLTIEKLGLTSALERRYATLQDISVNNILFVNRDARKVINGDVFDELASKVSAKPKSLDKVEEVSIEKFLADILPKATSLEVMVENRHSSNLVSLITAENASSENLFKWDNKFSWTYTGDMTDSVKERVKKAGGNVSGDLCCRLAWNNFDDLDFHMTEPGGNEIYFADKISRVTGGQLDVDMNAGRGHTREPVENIFYGDARKMKEGVYTLHVLNFSKRESIDVGFEAEIDFKGEVHHFAYDKALKDRETVIVARFKYSHKNGIEFMDKLPSTSKTKEIWGLTTNTFQKVNVLMNSPNYWDDHGVGNKHYFFMLDGCKNEDTARGFYNEFLKEELTPHRKVIEMVGAKMKTEESQNQLSGIGFSSTQRNSLLCKVSGSFTRMIKVVF